MPPIPEQDELVVVVIKKILPYGAFCVLPEYNNLEAFLHVSEVAPRWIKNIHEFISEGQRHVAKVYRLDREKNQIDVSLKRVNEEEKKRKLEFSRTQKRGEMLLTQAIKTSGAEITLEKATEAIEKSFDSVYACFETASEEGKASLKDLELPEKLIKQILDLGKKNIKKAEVNVYGVLTFTCFSSSGVETLKKILGAKRKGVEIHYLGAPHYKLTSTAKSYKEAEKFLDDAVEDIQAIAAKSDCSATFEREKK